MPGAEELRLRVASIRIGVVLTAVVVAGATAYALATWEQPSRTLILILAAVGLLGGVVTGLLPAERIVRAHWRELFFVSWAGLDIGLITALVAADGGTESPFQILFVLPLIFASLTYPLRPFLVVGALTLAGFAVAAAVGGDGSLSGDLFLAFALGSIALMCAWQAHNQTRQRRELTEAADALRESERTAATILETSYEAYVAIDRSSRIIGWNPRAAEIFGYPREEAVGRLLTETIIPPRYRDAHVRGLERYLETGEGALMRKRVEISAMHRDGHEFPVELSFAPVPTRDGETFHAFLQDITERRQAQESLRQSEERFRALVEGVRDYAIFALDPEGRIQSWNDGAEGVYGYAGEEIVGQHVSRFHPPEPAAGGDPESALKQAAAVGREEQEGWRVRADGAWFWANVVFSPLAAPSGKLRGFVAITRDITERKRAQEALREAEERFRTAFEAAPVGIALVDISEESRGSFLQVNEALAEISGYPAGELAQTSLAAIIHPEDAPSAQGLLDVLVAGDADRPTAELRCFRGEGGVVWVSLSASLVRGADATPLYAIAQLQDVSERKRFEGQLQYLADHDPLTGLLNRRRFEQELRKQVAFSERYGGDGAVLVVDLDNFKYVNDTLGHALGDELIGRVGSLIKARLRRTDAIARLGGDEFAVLLPATPAERAVGVAEELLQEIRSNGVVVSGGRSMRLTASVGVSRFGPETKVAADAVLVNADIAMYEAKAAGRDRVEMLEAEGPKTKMQARLTWSERIRDALQHDRFTLFQQPILELGTGAVKRHELLIRLVGPGGDLIPPNVFLYVAEQFGLIQAIDRWVCTSAIALLEERQRAGDDITLEVNLSGASIGDAALADFVESEVSASGIEPGRLIFEVTETAAIVNIDKAKRFAARMADLGCAFALDDFGAGFGSFYYLKHLPFDYLKIDGDFIRKLPSTRADQLTVRAIVEIARGLGKRTIAEFVGDEKTVEMLRDYGVDYAQGYHIGRPVPVEETWQPAGQPAA